MSVTITLPSCGDLIAPPPQAALLLVQAYGEDAVHQPIAGHRSDVDATWSEVDHLLAQAEEVACPGCGGRCFRAAYRVQVLCVVTLNRRVDGEILISGPGACVADSAPRPTEADFYELLCAHCGSRLDWSIDHRSLYVWERRDG